MIGRTIRVFFSCIKMTLLVNYFQKYLLKVTANFFILFHFIFCEIWESSKYRSITDGIYEKLPFSRGHYRKKGTVLNFISTQFVICFALVISLS